MEKLQFLTPGDVKKVRDEHGTPAYVYDLARLKEQAGKVLAFPNAFGLTVRYAMKASPNAAILKVFRSAGLHIDASSGFEVRRAVKAGGEETAPGPVGRASKTKSAGRGKIVPALST